ncbi:metalloprotease [Anaeramoeba flamelloides]|uniref:Metalloprotease n=1 Tax=Anaeramoeba flamelloides TaxID=1746091 RepID=A0ABQ8X478_9EUKA|nr:metalloprotease [Anaeramoeba flamelloides]
MDKLLISKLGCGIFVSSVPLPLPLSVLTISLHGGPRYERDTSHCGIFDILKDLILTRKPTKTNKQTFREQLLKNGILASSSLQREALQITSMNLRNGLPAFLDLFTENVIRGDFSKDNLDILCNRKLESWSNSDKNGETIANDLIHYMSYHPFQPKGNNRNRNVLGGGNLGQPNFCSPSRIAKGFVGNNIDALNDLKLVGDYSKRHFVRENITVSAMGIDHDRLCQLVENTLGKLPSLLDNGQAMNKGLSGNALFKFVKGKYQIKESQYNGGGLCCVSDKANDSLESNQVQYLDGKFPTIQNLNHMSVYFPSHSIYSPNLITSLLTKFLLGGGSSYIVGGPGKGIETRFYQVLHQYHYLDKFIAQVKPYSDHGLFGVDTTFVGNNGLNVYKEIINQLHLLAQNNPKEEELQRAKNQLKVNLFMLLERREILTADFSKQLMYYSKINTLQELNEKIDNITSSDVSNFIKNILKGNPSVALYGDTSKIDDLKKEIPKHYFFN